MACFLPGLTADHTLFDAQMKHFLGKANNLAWDVPDFVNAQIEGFVAELDL